MEPEVKKLRRDFDPLPRQWKIINSHGSTRTAKVMHFNVLADQLSEPDGFIGTTKEVMDWSTRRQRLLRVICDIDYGNPIDVLSIVECDHCNDFWVPALARLGLVLIHFASKFGNSQTEKTHGVALFVRESRFEVLGFHSVTDRVAIVSAYLRDRRENRTAVFATTHLKAKPHQEPIRRNQLNRLVQEFQPFINHQIPLILMGDFNTGLDEIGMITMMSDLRLQVPFSLPWTTWKERPVTNWQPGGLVKRTIDYFFTSPQIRPRMYLDCPEDQVVEQSGLLPGTKYPSDHLAIAFTFEWQ